MKLPSPSVFSFWPVLFVPATLYAVRAFGHVGADLLLGALFFYLFVFKSGLAVRRLMICLAVLATLFETANVAAGIYKYDGVLGGPLWISLGWGILGWWTDSLRPGLSKISFRHAFAGICAALLLFPLLNGTLSVASAIAAAGFYALSLATTSPFGLFLFTALFSMLAEYSGTAMKVWTYFDLNGSGAAIAPNLALLSLAYSMVMAFAFWVSGYEKTAGA